MVKINNENMNSVLDEPIQYNNNLKIGKQVIRRQEWIENNIITIRDIMKADESTVMDFNALK